MGTSALTSTELIASPAGYISVATSNAATVGTHFVTLNLYLTTYPNVTLT